MIRFSLNFYHFSRVHYYILLTSAYVSTNSDLKVKDF